MDFTLPQRLQAYIESELNLHALYHAMAEAAPSEYERQIFLELANNQRHHVQSFENVYASIIGGYYNPEMYPGKMNRPYQFALRQLVVSEREKLHEYYDQSLKTSNYDLKRACNEAASNKTDHINKLMKLMNNSD